MSEKYDEIVKEYKEAVAIESQFYFDRVARRKRSEALIRASELRALISELSK